MRELWWACGLAAALAGTAAWAADLRDQASPEQWTFGTNKDGDAFVALAEAAEVGESLDSAVIYLKCGMGFDAPQVDVFYWIRGQAFSGHGYMLDLFNSGSSGRPATYDLGEGAVSTAELSSAFSEPADMPPAYMEAIQVFQAGLPQASRIRVEFTIDLFPGETFSADFPVTNAAAMGEDLARYCPVEGPYG